MPPPPPCSGQRRASISSRLRRRCSQKFFFFFALFRVGPDAYFLFMAGALRWPRSHAKDRTRLIIGERHRSERHSPPTLFHVPNSIQSSLVTAVPRTPVLHPNLLSRGVPQSAALLFSATSSSRRRARRRRRVTSWWWVLGPVPPAAGRPAEFTCGHPFVFISSITVWPIRFRDVALLMVSAAETAHGI